MTPRREAAWEGEREEPRQKSWRREPGWGGSRRAWARQASSWGAGMEPLTRSIDDSMVVDDLDIVGVAVEEAKAEAELVVDIDGKEALLAGMEAMEAKAGEAELVRGGCAVEEFEEAGNFGGAGGWEAELVAFGEASGGAVGEGADGHGRW